MPSSPPSRASSATMTGLEELSLLDGSEHMRQGRLSAVALVEFFLERIDALDPDIRAWAHVAAAAAMCLGTVGSQTMGSIIRPAAYCGVVGVKPTAGLLSRAGMVPLAPTLDTPGTMARSVRDAAVLLQALTADGCDAHVARGAPTRPAATVGVAPSSFRCLDSETQRRFDEAVRVLRDQGHAIRELSLPKTFDVVGAVAQVIAHAEAAALQLDTFRERPADYSETYRRAIQRGLVIPAASYVQALRLRATAVREIAHAYRQAEVEVLVTPAAPGPAPHGLASTGDPSFNTPFTALGLPTVTVPMGFVEGLPVGLQIVGLPFRERMVFEIASRYEAAAGWARCRPDLVANVNRAGRHGEPRASGGSGMEV